MWQEINWGQSKVNQKRAGMRLEGSGGKHESYCSVNSVSQQHGDQMQCPTPSSALSTPWGTLWGTASWMTSYCLQLNLTAVCLGECFGFTKFLSPFQDSGLSCSQRCASRKDRPVVVLAAIKNTLHYARCCSHWWLWLQVPPALGWRWRGINSIKRVRFPRTGFNGWLLLQHGRTGGAEQTLYLVGLSVELDQEKCPSAKNPWGNPFSPPTAEDQRAGTANMATATQDLATPDHPR